MFSELLTASHDSIVIARKMEVFLSKGSTVQSMIETGTRQRLGQARDFLQGAKHLTQSPLPNSEIVQRSAVSRAYYCMYHSCRAVVYFSIQGDDRDGHSGMAEHLPKDFPNRLDARNKFRSMRLLRNEADYDPYARIGSWNDEAVSSISTAEDFYDTCRVYLQFKGI